MHKFFVLLHCLLDPCFKHFCHFWAKRTVFCLISGAVLSLFFVLSAAGPPKSITAHPNIAQGIQRSYFSNPSGTSCAYLDVKICLQESINFTGFCRMSVGWAVWNYNQKLVFVVFLTVKYEAIVFILFFYPKSFRMMWARIRFCNAGRFASNSIFSLPKKHMAQ